MSLSSVPLIVLDTHVVFEALLFADPRARAWQAALAAGHLDWIATPPMRDEFVHVLGRGLAAARGAPITPLLARWDALARLVPTPTPAPEPGLRCSDPDDQMFIDLARAAGARWLLSRDRAVLKLRARARAFGVEIVAPERLAL